MAYRKKIGGLRVHQTPSDYFDNRSKKAKEDGTGEYDKLDEWGDQFKQRGVDDSLNWVDDEYGYGPEGPLVQERHFKKATRPARKTTVTKQIMQDKGVVFSLTGGYYPTFRNPLMNESLNNAYDDLSSGTILVNESFNKSGPAGTMLRGNHVWFRYATQYIKTLKGIPGFDPWKQDILQEYGDEGNMPGLEMDSDADAVPDIIGSSSVLGKIVQTYWDMVQEPSKKVLTNWRELVTEGFYKKARKTVLADKRSLGTLKSKEKDAATQAPEEAIPRILEEMGYDGGKQLDADGKELMDTYGKGKSIDIIFRWNGDIYAIDVSQSRILTSRGDTAGATHTSMGALQTDVKVSKDMSEKEQKQLKRDMLKHFDESRKNINATLRDIVRVVDKTFGKGIKAGKGTGGANVSGLSYRETSEMMGFKSRMGIENIINKFKDYGMDISKRKHLSESLDAALHIMSGALFHSHGNFKDILVLSKEHKFVAGIDWRVKPYHGIFLLMKPNLNDIVLEPGHEFYMDYFMEVEMKLNRHKREKVLMATNMLWGLQRLYSTQEDMVTGKVYEQGLSITGGGYVVAGGALVWEPKKVSKDIMNFLSVVLGLEQGGRPGKDIVNDARVQAVLDKAHVQSKKFSTAFKRIDNPVSITREKLQTVNKAQGAAQAAYHNMNEYLKATAWAAPYVGIYYQGGQKSQIKPVLMQS